jgi:glutamine amidotransferase-like uncharacterized protein
MLFKTGGSHMLIKSQNRMIMAVLLSLLILVLPACGDSAQERASGEQDISTGEQSSVYDAGPVDEPEVAGELPEPEIPVPRIGIYSGTGSWDINVLALQRFFDHHELPWSEFDEKDATSQDLGAIYDIIWFPGGFAAEYKNFISDHANISSFIEEGGAFIGSCAGAYYASDILTWLGSDHQYPLGLFPGRGVGPLAGLIGWGETASVSLEEQHPANEGFDSNLSIYYFDGPYFDPYDNEPVLILARYAVNDQPAVIAGRHGLGKYLLLGPHPELGGYTPESPDFNLDGDQGAQWPWLFSLFTWFAGWQE